IIREVVCPALLILNENTNISKEVRRFISLPEDMLELDLLERSLNNSDISNDVLYRPMTRIIRLQELDDVEGVTFNLKGIITKFDSKLKAFEDGQGFRTMVGTKFEVMSRGSNNISRRATKNGSSARITRIAFRGPIRV
ncbi:hypothetical protein KI387_040539, partial [Taxus chinensis]